MTADTLKARRARTLADLEHAQRAAAAAISHRAMHRHLRRIRNAMATIDALDYLARTFCGEVA